MANTNPVFNNQLNVNSNTAYGFTMNVRKRIVKHMQGKTIEEQEKIIEGILILLDINLLAALDIAYATASIATDKTPS